MLRSTLLVIFFAFSASVYADELSYTYVQIGYGEAELDNSGGIDGDGPSIFGSAAVSENFHIFGEYGTADFGLGVDLNQLEAGLGYNTALSENLDIVGRLAYVNMEVDSPLGSVDENGYAVGVGLRGKVSERVELNGGLDFVDLDESDSETRAKAGFLFNFTDSFSVGANGAWWDDITVYQLVARFDFGE